MWPCAGERLVKKMEVIQQTNRKRVYINGILADSVEGLDLHIGQRVRLRRGGFVETLAVEHVTEQEIRLRTDFIDLDFPTRVEAALWS